MKKILLAILFAPTLMLFGLMLMPTETHAVTESWATTQVWDTQIKEVVEWYTNANFSGWITYPDEVAPGEVYTVSVTNQLDSIQSRDLYCRESSSDTTRCGPGNERTSLTQNGTDRGSFIGSRTYNTLIAKSSGVENIDLSSWLRAGYKVECIGLPVGCVGSPDGIRFTIPITAVTPFENGECGAALNSCDSGKWSDRADTPTTHEWNCIGSGDGHTDALDCASSKNVSCTPVWASCGGYWYNNACVMSCPSGTVPSVEFGPNNAEYCGQSYNSCIPVGAVVNGECGTAQDRCDDGDWTDRPDTATTYEWSCLGRGIGHTDATSCNAPKNSSGGTPGACGTANKKTYPNGTSGYGSDTQCNPGNSTNSVFPTAGNTVTWYCNSTNGGSRSEQCSASQSALTSCTPVWNSCGGYWYNNTCYIGSCPLGTTPSRTTGPNNAEYCGLDYNTCIPTGGGTPGACGPAAKTYAETATSYSGALCLNGGTSNPVAPTFPNSWTCNGTGGSTVVSGLCVADKQPATGGFPDVRSAVRSTASPEPAGWPLSGVAASTVSIPFGGSTQIIGAAIGGTGGTMYLFKNPIASPSSPKFNTLKGSPNGTEIPPTDSYFHNGDPLRSKLRTDDTGALTQDTVYRFCAEERPTSGGSWSCSDIRVNVAANPKGFLEDANCNTISGWTCDANSWATPLTVNIYEGANLIGTTPANVSREAGVGVECGNGTTAHGFSFVTPASLKTGTEYSISAKSLNVGLGSDIYLSNLADPSITTKKLNCPIPQCTVQTLDGTCNVTVQNLGGTSGNCIATYTGTCTYTCGANDTWTKVTNTCTPPPQTKCPAKTIGTCKVDEKNVGEPSGTCIANYTGSCEHECEAGGNWSISKFNDCTPITTKPVLTAPLIVKSGEQFNLVWDTNNGDETTCSLTGTGGTVNINSLPYDLPPFDIINNIQPPDPKPENGTTTNIKITARTTFTLTCGSLSDSKTVGIKPTEHEI